MKIRFVLYALMSLVLSWIFGGCGLQTTSILNADGVRLVAASDVAFRDPAWSPDGSRLATANLEGIHGGFPASELYIIRVANQEVDQLTHNNVGLPTRGPSWSNDGNRIAYYSSGEAQGEGIYLFDLNSGERVRFAGWANNAALSPIGQQIALWGPIDSNAPQTDWKLSVVDLTSLRERVILQTDKNHSDLMGISWARDGRTIAFSIPSLEPQASNGSSHWHQIYTVDVDGSPNLTPINHNTTADAIFPTWSPDGQYIAYTQGAEFRQTYLWVMNADGSCPIQLLDMPGINTPTWSPDGRYIAFEYEGGLSTLDLGVESILKRMEGLHCSG